MEEDSCITKTRIAIKASRSPDLEISPIPSELTLPYTLLLPRSPSVPAGPGIDPYYHTGEWACYTPKHLVPPIMAVIWTDDPTMTGLELLDTEIIKLRY